MSVWAAGPKPWAKALCSHVCVLGRWNSETSQWQGQSCNTNKPEQTKCIPTTPCRQWHTEVTCEQPAVMPGRPWAPWQGDLFVTKHRELLKAIKISNENRAAALLRTAFLLSPWPTQCGYDPAAPQCFLAPRKPHWWQQDCREAEEHWSWRWQCRTRAAHSDRSALLLQCRGAEKKRHFWWNSWSSGDSLNQCYTVHAACSVCCC